MYNIPIFPFRSFFGFLAHNILHFIYVPEPYSNYLYAYRRIIAIKTK